MENTKVNILNTEMATTTDKVILFNASGSPTGIVNDMVGARIDVAHIVNSIRKNEHDEEYNRCVLIDVDRNMLIVSSEPFIQRLEEAVNVFGLPTQENPLAIEVKKQKSSSSDNSYLSLDVIA